MSQPLAAYRRVSFVGARSGDSFRSPDDQAAEIVTWAKARGHEVIMLDAELDGKGSDDSRPIFREAVEGVKSGTYAGVVVAYLSRAGRDLRLMLDLWAEVEQAGGVVYSARENIDGSTASGRLHRNLLASIAQHELEERREGFDRARASAVERGIWQRRQTPSGYSRSPKTRRLVPDDRADLVQTAFASALAGEAMVSIADALKMTPSGVRQLLRNRVYLGELRVGGHVHPTAHPQIIDEATFEAVQAKLDARVRPTRSGGPPPLLAGLVRCAACGHVMTRSHSGGKLVYICPIRHSGERCPQPAAIMAARLHAFVEPIALGELRRVHATARASDRVGELRERIASEVADLDALLDRFSAHAASKAIERQVDKRQARIVALEAELRVDLARVGAVPDAVNAAELWPEMDDHERNALLRSLLAAVVVRKVGAGHTVAVSERALLLRHGAALALPRRGGVGGLFPIPFDPGGPDVLGIAGAEDGAEG